MKGTNEWRHRRGDVWEGNAYFGGKLSAGMPDVGEGNILGVIVGRVRELGKVEVQSMIEDENKQETRRLTEVRT